MAYDKHTWTCDEPITVERLNHIEDGIANAGGGDCGFECEEEIVTLMEESVTTVLDGSAAYGDLSHSQLINQDTITVTFNGTEYECEVREDDGVYLCGAMHDMDTATWDWSEYPFAIASLPRFTNIATQAAGTYSVKIEVIQEDITTTPCFDKARGYSCGSTTLTEETLTATIVEAQE